MNFLQRLFSQPKVEAMPADDPQTDGNIDETEQRQPSLLAPGLHVGKLTDIGQERKQNEDTFLVFDALIQHDYGQETFGLFIVADGMGGHQQGEVASALATRTVASHILRDVYLPYLTQDKQPSANRPINEALVAALQSKRELPGGKC